MLLKMQLETAVLTLGFELQAKNYLTICGR